MSFPSTPAALAARVVGSRLFESREPSSASHLEAAQLAERLCQLIESDAALFLERYGYLLAEEELQHHFDRIGAVDYEVRFHLARLRRSAADLEKRKRNRRYRCMLDLEEHGDFFSDHEIMRRAPDLYHAYVGRLLPERPQAEAFDEECTLSQRLLANMDADDRSQRAAQAAAAAARTEGENDDDDEHEENDGEETQEEYNVRLALEKAVSERELAAEAARAAASERAPIPGSSTSTTMEDDILMGTPAHGANESDEYLAEGMRVLQEERSQVAAIMRSCNGASASAAGSSSGDDGRPSGAGPSSSSSSSVTVAGAAAAAAAEQAAASMQAATRAHEHLVQSARDELLKVMRERFLSGEEREYFDYATFCDNISRFDDIEQESRDAEEAWFDDDDDDDDDEPMSS
jgi:hypothetical protein